MHEVKLPPALPPPGKLLGTGYGAGVVSQCLQFLRDTIGKIIFGRVQCIAVNDT
jgi:hypothetical protein